MTNVGRYNYITSNFYSELGRQIWKNLNGQKDLKLTD